MTNTELAIQKAVEGGWDSEECQVPIGARGRFNYDRAWLDPLFFKALGKTEGWYGRDIQVQNIHDNGEGSRVRYSVVTHTERRPSPEEMQHRLLDAIQQGQSINEFFGEILKK
jgi:hypothetical protein